MRGCVSICVCLSWDLWTVLVLMLCCLVFFFLHFLASPSLLPLTQPRLSLYSISMKARYVQGEGGCMCGAVHGWAHCSILWRLAGWGCGWETAAAETSAGAPLSHPVIVSPMKGSLITSAQRGLPSSPIPEIHDSPFLSPSPPTLPSLLLLPYPPLSPPFISTQLSVVQHSTAGVGVGASKILSQKNTHINTHTETPWVHMCVYVRAYAQFAKTVFPV